MNEDKQTTDYEIGYWQAVRDIWLLFLEIGNSNAQNIEKNIHALQEKIREANK